MQAIKPTVVIYGLIDPRDGKFRYIGQAKDLRQRMYGHFNPKHQNAEVREWVKNLKDNGLDMGIEILDRAIGKWDGNEREFYWIRRFYIDGHPLLNRKGITPSMFEDTHGREWKIPRQKVKEMFGRFQHCEQIRLIKPGYYESVKAAIDFWHEKRDEMFSEYNLR